jgi:hypothetical protein
MNPDVVIFSIGDEVYHKTSDDMGVVTGILTREDGVTYGVMWDKECDECWHYKCELVREKPLVGTNSK